MKKKIIITGGLGYIGTELCRLYSGESWNSEILVLDNKFYSERVKQLNKWNIKFIQCDILDKDFIKKIISDAHIIHHLAGITNVAYVKKESNLERDALIKSTAIQGTQNILDSMSDKAKIIFPSTHVIFEGLKSTKLNITENEQPSTFLAYSSSKVNNEQQIIKSGKNYIILRLGSVYGFSGDATRINIMPNLFSKIASQNGTIKLFSGGKQLKSLSPLIDVARCFKFMEEKNIKKEIFNVTKETVTVKQVAEICKNYNNNLKIETTTDEVPNLGYTLSNKKLLKTGFSFLYNLNQSIAEMIEMWMIKEKNFERLEYITKGEKEFIDLRGKISNHELTEPINLIGLISSKKGSVRANHYHPVQEQKCLLTKGQFISVYQDLLNQGSIKTTHLVNEGDLIVTKPNVAHAMIFTKDSVFLNLVRGEREHKNYGITHTIKSELVDNNEKQTLMEIYKFDCRSCGNKSLKRFISLGYQPLANNLKNNKNDKVKFYPLEVNFCENCFNCQLSVSIDSKEMFSNYLYTSSTSKVFRSHFEEAAKNYVKEFKLKKKSFIIDVGSNDGVALKPFKDMGFKKILGIEPAKNLAKLANNKGIKTKNMFLTLKNLKKIKGNADLILASNVFAHSDNLKEMAQCMCKLLKKNSVIVIEFQYIINTLKDMTFDNIYHEHYNYWSLTSFLNFIKNFKLKIYKVKKIDTHGGSLRVYLSNNIKIKEDKSVKKILKEEERFGIKKFSTYENFGKKITKLKKNFLKNIQNLKKNNKEKKIIGYGAPAKATTALNFYGIKNEIDFIIEDNPMKHNKFIPGVDIQIKSKNKIKNDDNILIVLAWNFFEDIKKNNSELSKKIINIKSLEN